MKNEEMRPVKAGASLGLFRHPSKSIIIDKLTLVNKPGAVRAFVELTIPHLSLKLRSVKVVQDGDKKPYVTMPDQPWTGSDGKQRWTKLVEFQDDSLKNLIQDAVLSAWKARLQEGGSHE